MFAYIYQSQVLKLKLPNIEWFRIAFIIHYIFGADLTRLEQRGQVSVPLLHDHVQYVLLHHRTFYLSTLEETVGGLNLRF